MRHLVKEGKVQIDPVIIGAMERSNGRRRYGQASEPIEGSMWATIKFKVSVTSARAPARSDQGHADEQRSGSDDESHAGVLAVPDCALG